MRGWRLRRDAGPLLDGARLPQREDQRHHGQPKKVDGIVYVPMFHPAQAQQLSLF